MLELVYLMDNHLSDIVGHFLINNSENNLFSATNSIYIYIYISKLNNTNMGKILGPENQHFYITRIYTLKHLKFTPNIIKSIFIFFSVFA